MALEGEEFIRVDCYAGHRGEQTPVRFFLGDRPIDVVQVLDQWLAPDHRYFKVEAGDGARYMLRHDTRTGKWALVMYERGP